jgi:hypothetical protein
LFIKYIELSLADVDRILRCFHLSSSKKAYCSKRSKDGKPTIFSEKGFQSKFRGGVPAKYHGKNFRRNKNLKFLHHVRGTSAVSITRIGPISAVPHVGLMPRGLYLHKRKGMVFKTKM